MGLILMNLSSRLSVKRVRDIIPAELKCTLSVYFHNPRLKSSESKSSPQMAFSSHPSRESKGKVIAIEREANLGGWISDDETRVNFVDRSFKIVVSPKYLDLNLFERENFQFAGWIETQELSTTVQMKGDWYSDLIRVFYHNLKVVNGNTHSRVKGVDIQIDNDVWQQVTGLRAKGIFSHLPNSETNRWLKKKDIYKSWLRFP